MSNETRLSFSRCNAPAIAYFSAGQDSIAPATPYHICIHSSKDIRYCISVLARALVGFGFWLVVKYPNAFRAFTTNNTTYVDRSSVDVIKSSDKSMAPIPLYLLSSATAQCNATDVLLKVSYSITKDENCGFTLLAMRGIRLYPSM